MPADHIRCIVRPRQEDARPLTFCGRQKLMAGWCFDSLAHAIQNADNNGRLLPCPACLDKAIEILGQMKTYVKESL